MATNFRTKNWYQFKNACVSSVLKSIATGWQLVNKFEYIADIHIVNNVDPIIFNQVSCNMHPRSIMLSIDF